MKGWVLSVLVCICLCISLPFRNDGINPRSRRYGKGLDSLVVRGMILQHLFHLKHDSVFTLHEEKIQPSEAFIYFYQKEYFLNWTNKESISQLIACLEDSWKEGLLPEDYHIDRIRELFAATWNAGHFEAEALVELDLLLSDAAFLFANHLKNGRLKEYDLSIRRSYESWMDTAKTSVVKRAIAKKHITEIMAQLRPHHNIYTKTMESLLYYEFLYRKGKGWQKIPYRSNLYIKRGERHSLIPLIRRRLAITHDYDPEQMHEGNTYDKGLYQAVKRFQYRHGLNMDGVIGPSTIEAMNIPIEKKIASLLINLERARWNLRDIESRAFIINIPAFQLYYLENNDLKYESRVVVGKCDRMTPEIRSHINYVVFNPSWHIPSSIVTEEILPLLQENPDFLIRNSMQIFDWAGEEIDPEVIDYCAYTEHDFPYWIKQKPGSSNALGTVKYLFPNEYRIYIHDTPVKKYFSEEVRTFSHGCIRVQNAMDLAYLLAEEEGFNDLDIDTLRNGEEPYKYKLKDPVQVIVTYVTAYGISDDIAFFYKDVYEKDKGMYYQYKDVINYVLKKNDK